MRGSLLALLLIAGTAAAADDALQPLEFLVGHCWRGTFPDGKAVDTHCFEAVYAGRFIRDRHVVSGERPRYEGESTYWRDAQNGQVMFMYFDSDGGMSTGKMIVNGERLHFPDEKYTGPDGKPLELRTVWEKKGTDGFVATTEQRVNGKWQEAWRVEYARLPAASEGANRPAGASAGTP